MHLRETDRAAGYLEFKNARVRWFLSINAEDLPNEVKEKQPTFRNISIDGRNLEFSDNFTDLHTASYNSILSNQGFGIEEARLSIQTTEIIQNSAISFSADVHPFVKGLR